MTTTTNPHEESLRDAIIAASEAADPMRQGECWPDPIEWDGRPLDEQASDLLAIVETPDVRARLETCLRAYTEAS